MVATIEPVGCGRPSHGRSRRIALSAVFALCLTLSAGLLGGLVSLIALPMRLLLPPVSPAAPLLLAAASIAVAVDALGLLPRPLPGPSWQVPRFWILRFSPATRNALYGAYLGVGLLTRLPLKTLYVALIAAAFLDPPAAALAIGCFGAGRAAAILVAANSASFRGPRLNQLLRARPAVTSLNVAALLANAAALAARFCWAPDCG